jgi:hypothetical protein
VRPGRAADHSPPSSAEVLEEESYTSTPLWARTGPVTGLLYFILTSGVSQRFYLFSFVCLRIVFSFAITALTQKKIKVTLVQALRLCTGRTAHRGSRCIALLIHNHGTRRGRGVNVTSRPLFTPGKDPILIVHVAGWAPGPVWTGAENLAPTGIRSPDRLDRSQSLYHLSYPTLTMCPAFIRNHNMTQNASRRQF